jgi:uncharacterized membrane protein
MGSVTDAVPERWLNAGDVSNVTTAERAASALGGGALVAAGLLRRKLPGLGFTLVGGSLLHGVIRGSSRLQALLGIENQPGAEVLVRQSITIQRERAAVYAFWRDFENHPRFMHRIEAVEMFAEGETHFRTRGPGSARAEWTSVITREHAPELIAWKTVSSGPLGHSGEVEFKDAPAKRGTEVQVTVRYQLPGGPLGALFTRVVGNEPEEVLAEDLRGLRQLLETGEISTVAGQPAARRTTRVEIRS